MWDIKGNRPDDRSVTKTIDNIDRTADIKDISLVGAQIDHHSPLKHTI